MASGTKIYDEKNINSHGLTNIFLRSLSFLSNPRNILDTGEENEKTNKN